MNAAQLNALLGAVFTVPSRRAALRILGGLGLAGLFPWAEAKKKHKRKKKCAKAGRKTSKKRRKCCKGLVKDATGHCVRRCTPATCPAGSCGAMPDGCGGTLDCGGCPANQICLRRNICQPCHITCTGTPTECGAELQQALAAGGTYYVCPGTYRGGFSPADAVTIIGAGEGDDPASNTVLDGGGAERVLTIPGGAAPVTLERVHFRDGRVITTGVTNISGGAILHQGTTLNLTECTVSISYLLNNSQSAFASGGGIAVNPGSTLEMTRCTVRDNHIIGTRGVGGGIWTSGITTLTDCLIEANSPESFGGGIYVDGGTTTLADGTHVRRNVARIGGGVYVDDGTVEIAESCRVTENTAINGQGAGGGIFNQAGVVTLEGHSPSPIVIDNCRENCGGDVPKCSTAPPVACPP